MKKIIRLTESDLHRIIKESVNRILKEDYYSMQKPYGSRKLSDYSSDESKALHDYDQGFGVWQKHNFGGGEDTYEPAPLGNLPNNEPEFPEDDQPYQYWNSLRDYEDRSPIDPSPEDKKYQMDKSWNDMKIDRLMHDNDGKVTDDEYLDTNLNVHDYNKEGHRFAMNAFKDGNNARKIRPTFRQSKEAGHPYF